MKKQLIEPTVDPEILTVKYWRERFQSVFPRFKGLTELANVLGPLEEEFLGIDGYRRLESIKRDKASLELTAKAVILMEQTRPAPSKSESTLKRQKLKTD